MGESINKPGIFCWIELGSANQTAAKSFYSGLFGWEWTDTPMGSDSYYTMMTLNGKVVAALYQLDSDRLGQGIPSHWLSYVSVENADKTAEKILEAGGVILKAPFDVWDYGRMAVAQDCEGAVFAIWQAGSFPGVEVVNQMDAAIWFELSTHDPGVASRFYSEVFGWRIELPVDPNDYTQINPADPDQLRGVGGMIRIQKEWGEVRPNWMVYFGVTDCRERTEYARENGAMIIKEPTDIPGIGTFSVIQDPQGAFFAIISITMPQP